MATIGWKVTLRGRQFQRMIRQLVEAEGSCKVCNPEALIESVDMSATVMSKHIDEVLRGNAPLLPDYPRSWDDAMKRFAAEIGCVQSFDHEAHCYTFNSEAKAASGEGIRVMATEYFDYLVRKQEEDKRRAKQIEQSAREFLAALKAKLRAGEKEQT